MNINKFQCMCKNLVKNLFDLNRLRATHFLSFTTTTIVSFIKRKSMLILLKVSYVRDSWLIIRPINLLVSKYRDSCVSQQKYTPTIGVKNLLTIIDGKHCYCAFFFIFFLFFEENQSWVPLSLRLKLVQALTSHVYIEHKGWWVFVYAIGVEIQREGLPENGCHARNKIFSREQVTAHFCLPNTRPIQVNFLFFSNNWYD